ncbi:MarR family transcriptional regulator [Pseudolysinimonas sp.]|uniref:MarR family winged helix-turn-helix transcriptional regulator n=1 Tax=Pseudolysinimonas sp. TaxID=2680009 RepID=UPI00286B7B15|nr:MarR family transcriptional regulator [Pseudolysinimonas sp.]
MAKPGVTPLIGDTRQSTVLYLIKQVELAIRAQIDEAVAPYGLTALQYTSLTVLARHPGMTSTQLARNSFVRIQTMAQHLASLEERHLIRRVRDPKMKRQVLVFLSEQGLKILNDLAEPIAELERLMLADFTETDAKRLRKQLGAIRVVLSGTAAH